MPEPIPPAAKRDIRNLVALLLCGVVAAFLVMGFFLYHYNPSGEYLAKNVLVSPATIMNLSKQVPTKKKENQERYTFEGIEFKYYDESTKEWKKLQIDMDKYAKFYQLIGNEKNVENTSDASFSVGKPASMAILIKTAGSSGEKAFQEIVFAPQGDLFRVQLIEPSANQQWVVFSYPQIFRTIHQLFIPQ